MQIGTCRRFCGGQLVLYRVGLAVGVIGNKVGIDLGVVGVLFAGTGHTIKDLNVIKNGFVGIYLHNAGNRVIGNTANNNFIGIYVATCPNLLLENMANGNAVYDIYELAGCDVRQENSPAP